MNIRIYQLDPIRAGHDAVTGMAINVSEKDPAIYNLVFEGDVDCEDKNELCAIFRVGTADHRAVDFHGHSLRTNDLIEIIENDTSFIYRYDSDHVSDGRLMCVNSCNFSAAKDQRGRIFGVFAEPGKLAEIVSFTSEEIRSRFMSDYDILRLSNSRYCICCGEAITHCNLDTVYDSCMNRMLRSADYEQEVLTAVRGPIFFCGMRMDKKTGRSILYSLNAMECQELLKQYRLPERFYEFNGDIRSLPDYPGSFVTSCI